MRSISMQMGVNFDFPVLGSEIPKIVEQFVSPENFILAQDPEHPDWILVGQGSEHLCDHLLVRDQVNDIDGILPDVKYSALAVMSYRWPGAFRIGENENEKLLIAIEVFTAQFRLAIEDYRHSGVH